MSVARLKFEETQEKRYVNMGYEKEEENLTDMVSYYIIELTKLKENKPRTADLLEKWLLIIGGDTEMIEKCKKEEGEIKDAIEQLEEMSADEKEREIYEQRERSRLIYNTEMNAARRKGLEEGEKIRRRTWRTKKIKGNSQKIVRKKYKYRNNSRNNRRKKS